MASIGTGTFLKDKDIFLSDCDIARPRNTTLSTLMSPKGLTRAAFSSVHSIFPRSEVTSHNAVSSQPLKLEQISPFDVRTWAFLNIPDLFKVRVR